VLFGHCANDNKSGREDYKIYANAINAPSPSTAARLPPLPALEAPPVLGAPVAVLAAAEVEEGLPAVDDLLPLLLLELPEDEDLAEPLVVVEVAVLRVVVLALMEVLGAAAEDAGMTPVPPVTVRTGE